MMKRISCIAFAAMVLITGCGPSPKITRRYKLLIPRPAATPTVRLSYFSMAKPDQSTRTTLPRLSDHGQAALINAIAEKAQSTKDLLATLGSPIKAPASFKSVRDETKFQRRLVFSVENTSELTSDRIEWVRFTIQLLRNTADTETKFLSWDKFVTNYETVDLGKLTFTQGNQLGLSAEDVAPGIKEITNLGVTAQANRNLQEELQLRQRYVTSMGILEETTAALIQQGVVGIDLTGNFIVDMDIDVADALLPTAMVSITNLTDKNGKAADPPKVNVRRFSVKYPLGWNTGGHVEDLKVNILLRARIRQVTHGERTIAEGDDTITLLNHNVTLQNQILIPKEDLRQSVFRIVLGTSTLNIQYSTGNPEGLKFATYDEARNFLTWLKDKNATSVGGLALILGSTALTTADIPQLSIAIHKLNW